MKKSTQRRKRKILETAKVAAVWCLMALAVALLVVSMCENVHISRIAYQLNIPQQGLDNEPNSAFNEVLKQKCRTLVEETHGAIEADYMLYSSFRGPCYYCKVDGNYYRYPVRGKELDRALYYVMYDVTDAAKATGIDIEEMEFRMKGTIFKEIQGY